MRTISAAFTRLARTFDAGVATRVRTIRKSDGWEVDLTDLCSANWVRGMKYAEGLDNNTVSFSVDLVRSVGENTLNPLRTSKANRKAGVADPVLAINRVVVVDVQVVPPDGVADDDNWIELVRGTIDRIRMNGESNTITLECRDESGRFIRAWQEYERNWPETIPQSLENVIQAVLDTATYDPGTWVPSVVRAVGDLVRPTAHNGYLYRCTTSGTSAADEPTSWNATPGGTTTDNTATWTNVGAMPAAAWAAAATKYLGSIIRPTTRNGYMYQCTAVTGVAPYTTGGAEPTWPTTYGGTVVDNELTWTLVEDMPDVYTPTSPSWSVTRASADDYGLPPQSYWDIVRAFVDQIGWNLRFSWVDGSARRRPVLRSISNPGDTYITNGDLGTYEADQYEVTSDVDVNGEHIRNVVEVVYAAGDETAARTQTRIRIQDSASVAAYGPQFFQGTMDSTGLINDDTEASKLAQIMLDALSRPLVTVSVRVPFCPWAQVGDGIKLLPRPEDSLLGATATSDGTFVACVQGVSQNTNEGRGATELQLQGFYEDAADAIVDAMPLQTIAFLNREARARVGRTPTLKRPGDIIATIYADSAQGPSSAGTKPGLAIAFGGVVRDIGGNVDAGVFTAPVAGMYSITAGVTIDVAPAAGSELFLSVVVDGNYVLQVPRPIGSFEAGTQVTLTVAGLVRLAVGDQPAVYVACDPSANLTTDPGENLTFLSIQLIR